MNYFLPVNQVDGLLNLVQQSFDIDVPAVQVCVGCLILWLESHFPGKTVDLGGETLVNNHVTDLLLGSILGNSNESGESRDLDLAVVLGGHSEVVLDQLPYELLHVGLGVLSAVLKWGVHGHLRLDLGLIEWEELISQQFVDKSLEQVVLLE